MWGINPVPGPHPPCYSNVVEGTYPDDLPSDHELDCVVFNDVLEHVADPWAVLTGTVCRLSTSGAVFASIPNVRHYRVLWDLGIRGRWEYRDTGILDRTHLRFFTESSIRALFETSGYRIESLTPISLPTEGKRGWIRRVTKRFDSFLTQQ
jgi:2-polyprenyl-3-methyl-5-hydroxy-6-metoxy-1,4-benzoquinol methylase